MTSTNTNRADEPANILVVDDTPANLNLLGSILSAKGYNVRKMPNGMMALNSARRLPPDLIMLDVKMPAMDGYEVCAELKADPTTKNIPIIFISALQEIEEKVKAFNVGGVDFVTKPFHAEEVISRVNTHITNARLRNDLILAKNRAEEANRAKSIFLANMSHELRTPLNAILGYSQILQQDSTINADHRQHITAIKSSGEYLLTLISDILDLAKVEAGRLDIFPYTFNLGDFLTEIKNMFHIRANKKKLTFHCPIKDTLSIDINADEKRLRQICMNLLSNAIKFTEQGEVRLDTDYQHDNLIISVTDTGIGISEQGREEIFRPFVQIGEQRYKQQGTGLGLAITYNLVKRMGGDIQLTSTLGKGSCFTVRIPAPVISIIASQVGHIEKTSLVTSYKRTDGITTPFKVLIVDDIAENRAVLNGLLTPLGFDISEATDGIDAVDITKQHNFDIILMDLVMRNMNGLTATQQILSRPHAANRLIFAISASAFEQDRTVSLAAGCKDYLAKPLKLSTLLQALHKHLPIEWEYVESSSPPNKSTETLNTSLTEEQRQILYNMLQDGAIGEIIQYLENLTNTPNCSSQAQVLLNLANDFKLADIRSILEE